MSLKAASKATPIDVFRDTYLRYFGYLGPFSVAFSRLIPLNISRMACTSYIISDVHDKLPKESCGTVYYKRDAIVNGGDVVIFHLISSMLVPRFVSKSVKNYFTKFLLTTSGISRALPGFMSIAVIPFISRYVDCGTNYTMNGTYRKFFARQIETIKTEEEQRKKSLREEMHSKIASNLHSSEMDYGENREKTNKKQNKEKNEAQSSSNNNDNDNNKESEKIGEGDAKVSEKNAKNDSIDGNNDKDQSAAKDGNGQTTSIGDSGSNKDLQKDVNPSSKEELATPKKPMVNRVRPKRDPENITRMI